MGARSRLGLVLTATVVAGCGSGVATPPSGPRAAIVTITRGFGQETLTTARAAAGQSALDALRRSARVSTRYGGRFVQAIDGLAGDPSHGMAWLYFVNGIQANVGSAERTRRVRGSAVVGRRDDSQPAPAAARRSTTFRTHAARILREFSAAPMCV